MEAEADIKRALVADPKSADLLRLQRDYKRKVRIPPVIGIFRAASANR